MYSGWLHFWISPWLRTGLSPNFTLIPKIIEKVEWFFILDSVLGWVLTLDRVLRWHQTDSPKLHTVPVHGQASARKRYGYCADETPIISELFAAADQSLFERVLRNELHVLQPLLPEKKIISNYNLRARQHDRQLIRKSAHINDFLFIVRMLYRDSY